MGVASDLQLCLISGRMKHSCPVWLRCGCWENVRCPYTIQWWLHLGKPSFKKTGIRLRSELSGGLNAVFLWFVCLNLEELSWLLLHRSKLEPSCLACFACLLATGLNWSQAAELACSESQLSKTQSLTTQDLPHEADIDISKTGFAISFSGTFWTYFNYCDIYRPPYLIFVIFLH